jgi:hypothetical protein
MGKRERAEAYARQAAEAASRGEYRNAAALYKVAVLALAGDDEGDEGDELAFDARLSEPPPAEPAPIDAVGAACPAEAE